MYTNIVVVTPSLTYGDTLSTVPLLFFLCEYYERVHFFLDTDAALFRYFTHFFQKHPFFGARIFLMMDTTALQAGDYDEYHVCNLHTGDWKHSPENYLLSQHPKIAPEHYFCDRRPLFDFHVIDPKYLCAPQVQLPLATMELNSVVYYKMVGLNARLRLDYFDYERDYEKEAQIKQEVLNAAGISPGAKYNVMYSAGAPKNIATRVRRCARNDLPMIDLHNLAEFPGWLFSLVEGAEEIHLVEGSNTNLIYFAQHIGVLFITHLPVYYHIWARERRAEHYNLDWYWKMADEPRHPNWVFEMVQPSGLMGI